MQMRNKKVSLIAFILLCVIIAFCLIPAKENKTNTVSYRLTCNVGTSIERVYDFEIKKGFSELYSYKDFSPLGSNITYINTSNGCCYVVYNDGTSEVFSNFSIEQMN